MPNWSSLSRPMAGFKRPGNSLEPPCNSRGRVCNICALCQYLAEFPSQNNRVTPNLNILTVLGRFQPLFFWPESGRPRAYCRITSFAISPVVTTQSLDGRVRVRCNVPRGLDMRACNTLCGAWFVVFNQGQTFSVSDTATVRALPATCKWIVTHCTPSLIADRAPNRQRTNAICPLCQHQLWSSAHLVTPEPVFNQCNAW